jgi:hypothetical protein
MRHLALFVLIAVLACSSATEPTAPPAIALASCINTPTPPIFRLVLQRGDTMPPMNNLFIVPLTNVESIRSEPNASGNVIWIGVTYKLGYCVTLLDSAVLHTKAVAYVIAS